MTEAEMRRMVGSKIFDAYYPDHYTNHDAESRERSWSWARRKPAKKVRISRRATEADLVIYLNVNFVPMDGGHKSVGTGLTDYLGLRAPPHAAGHPGLEELTWSRKHSELHSSVDRIGRVIDQHVQRLPRRDGPEQQDVRWADGLPGKARGGLHRPGFARRWRGCAGRCRRPRGRSARTSSTRSRRRTG